MEVMVGVSGIEVGWIFLPFAVEFICLAPAAECTDGSFRFHEKNENDEITIFLHFDVYFVVS